MKKSLTLYLSLFLFLFTSINIFSQVPIITVQPTWQGVIVGQTATFQVTASGSGLSYQWYKNDALITGATNPFYTTPVTVIGDNNSIFSVKVTNISGSDSSNGAKLFVTAAGSRVSANLQLLYNFNEAGGSTIHDNSGVGTAYNLGIDNSSAVTWTPNGMGVNNLAYINADLPATKMVNAVKSTNELTFEAWLVSAIPDQTEGARVITLSEDNYNTNLSVIVINHKFIFKLRTTNTDASGEPSLTSSDTTSLSLTHLVFTRTSNGTTKVYINGVQDTSSVLTGNFSNWDNTYRLQIANEFGNPRPWLGTFYLVSVYNRALSPDEVQENYTVGVPIDHKPQIIIEPSDLGLITHQTANFSVSAVGDSPLSYQWIKNGVNITGATSSSYSIPSVFDTNTGDEYSVIVSNTGGADTSRNATLFVTGSNNRVSAGQILYYNFQGGKGDSVVDSSGFGTALNLKINNSNAVEWKPYGLVVDSIANITSNTDASKVTNEIISSGQFTFEAWIKPKDLTQSPATIFTIANEINPIDKRNFTINQYGNYLKTWLRISTASDAGMELNSPSGSFSDSLINVVYTHNTKEVSRLYINGVQVAFAPYFVGDLSNWNPLYPISLADQFSTNQPWKGIYNLISFYNRALDSAEIVHNYEIGPLGVELKSPGNLTAQVPHAGMVQLTWKDSSNNEDGFIIERRELDPVVTAFLAIDTVLANDTTYTDLTVADTTLYKYRVKAYSLVAESGYSNEVTIKTLLSIIPAPTELNAITYNPDTVDVKLSWKDNSSNELGFVIQRKLGDSASVSAYVIIDTTAANVTSFTDTTTSDTTKYTYRIYAYNADTVSAFSNIATGTTPLPVELTSFSANEINGKILLVWETATEINNTGFSIERSTDNIKFSEVAFIKGKGTTTEKAGYSYTDKSVLSGKYYYRLKQVDFDGTYHYTKSIEVDMGLPRNYSLEQNYPNPFNPTTTIRFALPMDAKVNIKLYNTLGQEVANILNTNMNAGVHETVFNASNLSSGVYFYRLEAHGVDGSNFITTKRMILMK